MLFDTNVLIYASETRSRYRTWARGAIADAVAGDGAFVNAVSIAEICVGDAEPSSVCDRIRAWGLTILDIPVAAAEVGACAYALYRARRKAESGKDSPAVPLPDFFIGAHAQIMGWRLATVDADRFRVYFPKVRLVLP